MLRLPGHSLVAKHIVYWRIPARSLPRVGRIDRVPGNLGHVATRNAVRCTGHVPVPDLGFISFKAFCIRSQASSWHLTRPNLSHDATKAVQVQQAKVHSSLVK